MKRWLLFAAALLLGGWLGSLLLSEGGLGQLAFLAACGALGWGFYQIDRRTRR